MGIWIFAICCTLLLIMMILWAWWQYNADKLAPGIILAVSMLVSGIVCGFLASVATLTFGG